MPRVARGRVVPDYRQRAHPYRLPPEFYRLVDQPFFISARATEAINLARPELAEAILGAMGRVGRRAQTRMHAYCLMPDHFHVVVSVASEGGDVARWLRYTKREVAKMTGQSGMWQRSWWDHYLRDDRDLKVRTDYLLNNPVRKVLCRSWVEWTYSWCEWPPYGAGRDPNL